MCNLIGIIHQLPPNGICYWGFMYGLTVLFLLNVSLILSPLPNIYFVSVQLHSSWLFYVRAVSRAVFMSLLRPHWPLSLWRAKGGFLPSLNITRWNNTYSLNKSWFSFGYGYKIILQNIQTKNYCFPLESRIYLVDRPHCCCCF